MTRELKELLPMLIGEYKTSVTAGNRTALPIKLREELGEKIIITRGYEGCLVLVSLDQWEKMIVGAASGPFVSESVRDTSRFLLGSASEIILDSQGRFVVPAPLKAYAQISDEVVFLGLGRWVEVWSREKWEKRREYIDKHGSSIAEKLSRISVE